jgi:hypothetical protein
VRLRRAGFHRTHFLERQCNFLGAHDILVSAHVARQFVGDGLLEIRQDLVSIRITTESCFGTLEVGSERLIPLGFDLPGMPLRLMLLTVRMVKLPSLRLFC